MYMSLAQAPASRSCAAPDASLPMAGNRAKRGDEALSALDRTTVRIFAEVSGR
jgi:hypothetical protein